MAKRSESSPSPEPQQAEGATGISNRESAREEEAGRATHPPAEAGSPPAEDAAGRVGDQPISDDNGLQTSHKTGSRSMAQKEAESRYPDRSMPASRKVAGAFGKEPSAPADTTEPE